MRGGKCIGAPASLYFCRLEWDPLSPEGLESHFEGGSGSGDEEDRFEEALRDAVQDTTANEGADDDEGTEG